MATPPLLQRCSSDEYAPLPVRERDHRIARHLVEHAAPAARSIALDGDDYVVDRRGTAATLRAIDDAAGGGFYRVPDEALTESAAADEAFSGREPVIDTQTHLVNPHRWNDASSSGLQQFLAMVDPERWPDEIDPGRLDAAAWASLVLESSETAVALLTSTPGMWYRNVLTNQEIAACREITDRYAGTGRVLSHTIVHPNETDEEIESMGRWVEELAPTAWKVYTLTGKATAASPGGGWFLDDPDVGHRFLEAVRASGVHTLAAHKGISGLVDDAEVNAASPRDVGPAAAAFPDLTFVIFHSGYEPDPDREEGRHDPARPTGVSRLVASLESSGIGPDGNVYAELGSTWFLMLRRPVEAAHVLGKLLASVGPERILWGTDSVWYGSPQSQIDAFRAFTIPEWMQEQFGYPAFTAEDKEKVLSLNARRVYGIDDEVLQSIAARRDSGWVANATPVLRRMLAGGEGPG